MDISPESSTYVNYTFAQPIQILSQGWLSFSPRGVVTFTIECIQKPSFLKMFFLKFLLGAKWVSNKMEYYISSYESKESILKRYPKAKFKE